ncbi:alpha/beta fold hydrolase [Thermodesulfobacteriota bacterium]
MSNDYSINQTWKPLKLSLFIALILFVLGCNTQKNYEVEDGKISVNGIEIYYKTMGKGTPTFVLHGGPGDSHDTMLQLKALADQYKLIFYDQRAAGRSSGDEDTSAHSVENFVEDLEQLRLKLAPGKINIIGGSWGAMLAMQYAMKYSKNINALVLMSSMGIRAEYVKAYRANIDKNRTTEDNRKLEEIVNTADFKNRIPDTMEKYWRIYFRAYFYNPELADNINLWMRDTTYKQIPGRYAKLGTFLNSYDLQDDLNKISCPTLILHGDYDPTPIEWVKPIHDNIAESQMSIIKNAGHWLWVEAPDQVLTIIRKFFAEN